MEHAKTQAALKRKMEGREEEEQREEEVVPTSSTTTTVEWVSCCGAGLCDIPYMGMKCQRVAQPLQSSG